MAPAFNFRNIANTLLYSHSQVFFAQNRLLGVFLMLVSLVTWPVGLAGIVSVISVYALVHFMGFHAKSMHDGTYGFNPLLTGLGLGVYFEPSWQLYLLVIAVAVFTFFISLSIEGVFYKYGLPFLSIPFLLGMWLTSLSVNGIFSMGLSQRGIYTANELHLLGGNTLVQIYLTINEWNVPMFIHTYLNSLAAIFFQSGWFAGFLVMLGIIIYSRISFVLSLLGFGTAYLFHQLLGIETQTLSYSFMGFNYILTAMALGGYFLIPSRQTFLFVMILVPISVLITVASSKVLSIFSLGIYSLPFNVLVLLFLYALKLRYKPSDELTEVPVQHHSPERNLYHYKVSVQRFQSSFFVPIGLPFSGIWQITQAHHGEHTHKGDWAYAWDFEIADAEGKTYSGSGEKVTDYYCYGKNVLAPADGEIIEVIQAVPDNAIGQVNLKNNWGNAVVIKHTPLLYTLLCHFIPNSIGVKKGDFVRKGAPIAKVGNSGRSPYPHLHMQFQSMPFVGSATLNYPLGHIVVSNENQYVQKSFYTPKLGDKVGNIQVNPILESFFHFIPGQKLSVTFAFGNKPEKKLVWEILSTPENYSYIYCAQSQSFAYFYNDGQLFWFTNFVGNNNSELFVFFTLFYRVQLGYYPHLTLTDNFPLHLILPPYFLWMQDFIAPFKLVFAGKYKLTYQSFYDDFTEGNIKTETELSFTPARLYHFSGKMQSQLFYNKLECSGTINKLPFNLKVNTQHEE